MTRLQVEYVTERTESGQKDVIRILKLFRDWIVKESKPPSPNGGPSSYLLELIVVHAASTLEAGHTKQTLIEAVLALLQIAQCFHADRPQPYSPSTQPSPHQRFGLAECKERDYNAANLAVGAASTCLHLTSCA